MKRTKKHILHICCGWIVAALMFTACTEDPILWNARSTEQVITQYVETNADYSEFYNLLLSTGLNSLLSVRGPFTLFLPTNAAMREFYTERNVSSFTGFTDAYNRSLVLNHLIPLQIETSDIGLGALTSVNGIGDYLVTEFSGSDIILNKRSRIVRRNILTANGVVHIVNKVIPPVENSVFDVVADNPSFSIFAEGLRRTNLVDTLELIEFQFGNKMARTRFTIFAIADTTFNRFGIFSINDLINKYTDDPGSITQLNNGFYRYMEYHCLAETYFMNNFETRLYPILSNDNNVSFTVDVEDYKINRDPVTLKYTGFYEEQSNFPAKNGAVHTINDLMPVYQPRPAVFVWETTDHFDMKQGDYFGKHYMRWHDGQNTFKNIKWEGDYLLYYFKDHNTGKLMNHDCLSMSGWWWIEVKTPKIMKGKYRITSNLWSGQIDYAVYFDGENTANILQSDPAETTSWGEFEWTETREHTIRIVAKTPGLLFWDTVIFTPIQ